MSLRKLSWVDLVLAFIVGVTVGIVIKGEIDVRGQRLMVRALRAEVEALNTICDGIDWKYKTLGGVNFSLKKGDVDSLLQISNEVLELVGDYYGVPFFLSRGRK